MSADESRIRIHIEDINEQKLRKGHADIARKYEREAGQVETSYSQDELYQELSWQVVDEERFEGEQESYTPFRGERSYIIMHDHFTLGGLVDWMECIELVGSVIFYDCNNNPIFDGWDRLRRDAEGKITIERIRPEF
jgi:hypothetical protein